MSRAQYADATAPAGQRTFDAERWTEPFGLFARAMLAYIFVVDGRGQDRGYGDIADYLYAQGVNGRLPPPVILTELGGGLLVLIGLKTRSRAIALFGFCLLTALFLAQDADRAIQLQKNIAMAGGFLTLAIHGTGAWSPDAWRARAG